MFSALLDLIKAMSTLLRFQNYKFKTHRSILVHTTNLMRFGLSTLKRSKTIEFHVVTHMLQKHAPTIFSVIVFILMRFRPTNTTMRFRFDPLSRACSNRCVFHENAHAQGISVDGRSKCIEMYAFSNENALQWTGPYKTVDDLSYFILFSKELSHPPINTCILVS